MYSTATCPTDTGDAPEAERGVVPVHAATSMDAPNPDAGEEHPHTNAQLFGTVAPEGNRFVSYEQMRPPFNADRRTTISLGPTNRW